MTLAAGGVVAVLAVIALAAPLLVDLFGVSGPAVRDPTAISLGQPSGPSSAHPFGVDLLGRDVLARVLYGARTALFVSVLGAVIAALVGGGLGLLAVRLGRIARTVLAVPVQALVAFPVVLLGFAVGASCDAGGCAAGALSPGVPVLVFVVAVCGAGPITAVALTGAGWRGVAAAAARFVPVAILLDAALGFLDVGVRGSTADWGQMLGGAERAIVSGDSAWWLLLFPGVALVVAVTAWRVAAGRLGGAAPALPRAPRDVSVAAVPAIAALAFVLFDLLPRRGPSLFDQSALGPIWSHLSGSVSLLAGVVVIWLVAGTLVGIAMGPRGGRALWGAVSVLGWLPVFWLGLIAVWLFSSDVGQVAVLPGVGRYVGLTADPSHWLGSLVLPWLVLGLWWMSAALAGAREPLSALLGAGFVRVARAKGLSRMRVFWVHTVRAVAPVVGAQLVRGIGTLLGGALLTEVVFRLGGAGLLAYNSARAGRVDVAQWLAVLAAWLVVVLAGLGGVLGGFVRRARR